MSNCETFNLPAIDLEPHQFREVLRCIVHTILFNRALGYVKPRDIDSEFFDITYVTCGDPDVEQQVESRLGELSGAAERSLGEAVQVTLSFFERRRKQAWFGSKDERLYWEQWCINLNILPPDMSGGPQEEQQGTAGAGSFKPQRSMYQPAGSERAVLAGAASSLQGDRHDRLQSQVEAALTAIARSANERRDHIPPIVSASIVTFPFDLLLAPASASRGSAFGLTAMKKMLLQTIPPPML